MEQPGPVSASFGVLGPLLLERDGGPSSIGGLKPRVVLAMLLMNVGRVVSVQRLVDGLWGDAPPDGVSNTLQVHVSQLRRRLVDTDAAVVTQPPGYLLQVAPGRLDLLRFEELSQQARDRAASGHLSDAAALMHDALGLWRGAPLEDLDSGPFADSARAFLEERRLGAVDDRLQLLLDLRRDREVVEACEEILTAHPLRESVWEKLILSLYRSGRQAESLARYRECRSTLLDELGVEPMPRLRLLEQQILNHDRRLDPGPRGTGALVVPVRERTRSSGTATVVRSNRLDAVLVLEDGATVPLSDRVVLGRQPDCDVVLDDASVSRRHAEIRLANGRHVLLDLSSTNGTWRAGEPVMQHCLSDDDVFSIGDRVLRYRTR